MFKVTGEHSLLWPNDALKEGYVHNTLYGVRDKDEVLFFPSQEYYRFGQSLADALMSGNSSAIAEVFDVRLNNNYNKNKILSLAVAVAFADDGEAADVQVRARAARKDGSIQSLTQAVGKILENNGDGVPNSWSNYQLGRGPQNRETVGDLKAVAFSTEKQSSAFAYADTKAIDELVVEIQQITDIAIKKLATSDQDVHYVAQDAASAIAVAIAVAIAQAYGYVDVTGQGGSAYAYSTASTEAFAQAVSIAIIEKLYVAHDTHSMDISGAFAEAMGFIISRTAADASIQVFSEGGTFQDQVRAVEVAVAQSISKVLAKAFLYYKDYRVQAATIASTQNKGIGHGDTAGIDQSSVQVIDNCQALTGMAESLLKQRIEDQRIENALIDLMSGCQEALSLRNYLPEELLALNNILACPVSCKEAICRKDERRFKVVGLCDHHRRSILAHVKTGNFCSCKIEFTDEVAIYLASMEFSEECPQQCQSCDSQAILRQNYAWRGTCGLDEGWRIFRERNTAMDCSCKK